MLGREHPFSPSVPAETSCLFTVVAGVHVFSTGESLHCFLAGWCTNKSYVIAASDLWLFIHASNLLPLKSPHHSPTHVYTHRQKSEMQTGKHTVIHTHTHTHTQRYSNTDMYVAHTDTQKSHTHKIKIMQTQHCIHTH